MQIYLDATISNLNANLERNQLILLVETAILHNIDFKSELAEVAAPNEHGQYIDQNRFYCAENTVMLWNINFEDIINLVRNPNAIAIITSALLNQLCYGGLPIYERVKNEVVSRRSYTLHQKYRMYDVWIWYKWNQSDG